MDEQGIVVFRHHWLAYWKHLATTALLIALGPGGLLLWPPLGIALVVMALINAAGIYLSWMWHTFTFTEDNRLVRRRGPVGNARDVITLFGVITPYQIPFLGEWLDVGSIYLGIPGPNIHIHHIANFAEFYHRLYQGARPPGHDPDPPPIHIVLQWPDAPPPAWVDWWERPQAEGPQ